MKKLFDKNEITFAVVMIVVYVVGMSIMNSISETLGLKYLAECFLCIILTAVFLLFIRKNGLTEYYGLCMPKVTAAQTLYYIPMLLIPFMPLMCGAGLEYSVAETFTHSVSMLFVGFLEEVIFRGFLFRAMAKSSEKRAVIVTALTFAFGHIVNLLNGYEIFDSITQISYAVAVGFMLVFVLIRTGSLVPCIIFHSLNNILTAFSSGKFLANLTGSEQTAEIIMLAVMMATALGYTVFIMKKLPKKELES